MNDTQTRTIENDSNGYLIRSMIHEFYNRKMISVVALVWFWAIIFIAGAAYSGVQFFKTDQIKDQIMFAAVFVCCFQGIGLIKMFAWQMIHRNTVIKHIKRLDLRIAELNEFMKNK